MQIVIKKGAAIVAQNGLRCRGPRVKDPSIPCGKLVVKKSSRGGIEGHFKCERCGQEILVEMS